MKTIRFVCLMVAMTLTVQPMLRAALPPEALNLHYRNGNVVSTAFTDFRRVEFSDGNMVFVGRTPVTVKMADLSKITFQSPEAAFVPVNFAVTGEGLGSLSALVLEDNRAIVSGTEVEEGCTLRFTARAEEGYKVQGWRVNGVYEETEASVKEIAVYAQVYPNGLNVEVAFTGKTDVGNEKGQANMLLAYVQNREVYIRSAVAMEGVELWNVGGSLVLQTNAQRSHQTVIPVGNLTAGVYVLRVRTAQKAEIRKVIIR